MADGTMLANLNLAGRLIREQTYLRMLPERQPRHRRKEKVSVEAVLEELRYMFGQSEEERPFRDILFLTDEQKCEAASWPADARDAPSKRGYPEWAKQIWRLDRRLTIEAGDQATFIGAWSVTWAPRLYCLKRALNYLSWTGEISKMPPTQRGWLAVVYGQAATLAARFLYHKDCADLMYSFAPELVRQLPVDRTALPKGRPDDDFEAQWNRRVWQDIAHKNGILEYRMLVYAPPGGAPDAYGRRVRHLVRIPRCIPLVDPACQRSVRRLVRQEDGSLEAEEVPRQPDCEYILGTVLDIYQITQLFITGKPKKEFQGKNLWTLQKEELPPRPPIDGEPEPPKRYRNILEGHLIPSAFTEGLHLLMDPDNRWQEDRIQRNLENRNYIEGRRQYTKLMKDWPVLQSDKGRWIWNWNVGVGVLLEGRTYEAIMAIRTRENRKAAASSNASPPSPG